MQLVNYDITSAKTEIRSPHLQIRNINELMQKMSSDPFYQGNDLFERFKTILNKEMI
jgi:hypothetical protein